MAANNFPLLFFPPPAIAQIAKARMVPKPFHRPDAARQRERLTSRMEALTQAFAQRRVALQQTAPGENPELVLIMEIVDSIQDFANAVAKIDGFEWLLEWEDEDLVDDPDFYFEDDEEHGLPRRLFLVATNETALQQLLSLWEVYKENPAAKFGYGLAKFKRLFETLRDIRFWSVPDRLGSDVRSYWRELSDDNISPIRFEIEAWCFSSPLKNQGALAQISARIAQLRGQILSSTLIPEINYHGVLVELPRDAIAAILGGDTPELLLADRIMFFRPRTQCISEPSADETAVAHEIAAEPAEDAPVVALLDGLPQQNHPLLAARLDIDDPEGWEAQYEAKDRVHGTSMASLILHGDLNANGAASRRRLYVRPVLLPDPADMNQRRRERIPDNVLLLDLVHRAVKRICEGDGGEPPAAPSVRVINLSIGDPWRVFDREMSPWARLIDWLSFRYRVLFVVSAGNDSSSLSVGVPRQAFPDLTPEQRTTHALDALLDRNSQRRLIAPAESINALTVGALHEDASAMPNVAGRFDLFAAGGMSPLSRIGHGFRRAVKPDILMPGGRLLYSQRYDGSAERTTLDALLLGAPPGLMTAIPPLPGQPPNSVSHSRGTSNAAALASRAATLAFEVIETLRPAAGNAISLAHDAVLLKALLVHGASWAELSPPLVARRPDIAQAERKNFLARCLGYGLADVTRALECAAERATLIATGEMTLERALVFAAPLPPSLAGKTAWRRLTLTLAWLSPINPSHQAYRRAKLSVTPPSDTLQVRRENSVNDKAAQRGTVQHEILEGDSAVAFIDGAQLVCKVSCAARAGSLADPIPFALCLTLETRDDSGIPVYEEIRARIATQVQVQAG